MFFSFMINLLYQINNVQKSGRYQTNSAIGYGLVRKLQRQNISSHEGVKNGCSY